MLKRFHLSTALLALPLFALLVGCSAQVGYRSYDPYYHDYHTWDDAETPYYNQWIIETHHRHEDYRRLDRHDRDDYWRWRHEHGEHH